MRRQDWERVIRSQLSDPFLAYDTVVVKVVQSLLFSVMSPLTLLAGFSLLCQLNSHQLNNGIACGLLKIALFSAGTLYFP